jgi:hypothetical protein
MEVRVTIFNCGGDDRGVFVGRVAAVETEKPAKSMAKAGSLPWL